MWILFATGTTLSVPALTGAIMCMGVATANSVLVISFARERLEQIGDPIAAALDAGFVRFRPVLMTALAMIIGMAPMALGLGEGGEQNAPLGRAVIGGLVFATVATLVFVPVVFSLLHRRRARGRRRSECLMSPETRRPCGIRARAAHRRASAAIAPPPSWSLGIATRKMADARCAAWTEARPCRRRCDRARHPAADDLSICPAGSRPIAGADLRARQRLHKAWKADIGTPVKAGQLLAEIDAPDLDQQIMQAEADVASAQANAGARAGHLAAGASLIQPARSRSGTSISERPNSPTGRAGGSSQANLDRCGCWRNTSASPRRSTGSSRRAPPMSAR